MGGRRCRSSLACTAVQWQSESMAKSSTKQGTVMMVVGALMVVVALITVLVTSEPLPLTVAILGIVFLAVGQRKRRGATRF